MLRLRLSVLGPASFRGNLPRLRRSHFIAIMVTAEGDRVEAEGDFIVLPRVRHRGEGALGTHLPTKNPPSTLSTVPDSRRAIRVHPGHPHRLVLRMAGRGWLMMWKSITDRQCLRTPGLAYSQLLSLTQTRSTTQREHQTLVEKGGISVNIQTPFFIVAEQVKKQHRFLFFKEIYFKNALFRRSKMNIRCFFSFFKKKTCFGYLPKGVSMWCWDNS